MTEIDQSSRRMGDIIAVIDGIAFQTNILALNAAVEAARAGDAGRGFAVVASEVRSLAQRSGQAAKEIRELIQNSMARTVDGGKRVRQAGETMRDIVSSVKRVTDIMGEISAASAEQSSRCQRGAEQWYRTGQRDGDPVGRNHPAECRVGGRGLGGGAQSGGVGQGTDAGSVRLHPCRPLKSQCA